MKKLIYVFKGKVKDLKVEHKKSLILTENQISSLSRSTQYDLLDILYIIEDELCYNCKKISNTIDYLKNL